MMSAFQFSQVFTFQKRDSGDFAWIDMTLK